MNQQPAKFAMALSLAFPALAQLDRGAVMRTGAEANGAVKPAAQISITNPAVLLPDGSEFVFWERPAKYRKAYYVDNRHPKASDENPGTPELPFHTINKAAQVLQPGERVVIKTGVYREKIVPARGGTGPEAMISYEAAPGAEVVVKGSRPAPPTGWTPSGGWALGPRGASTDSASKIWRFDIGQLKLEGYNPFGMLNMPQRRNDTANIGRPPQGLRPYVLTRGMVLVDGKRLEQVEMYRELAQKDGRWWAEDDGMTIHVRLPGDAAPASHEIELAVQDSLFRPRQRHLGYIRIKGITFEHCANVFPRPQRGMVSANRGHHWIIEDCLLRHANSVGIDIGNESPDADASGMAGFSIVRRNRVYDAGICGIAGTELGKGTLVEENVVEHIGWQDAEPGWENAGIKLHVAEGALIRNNVIRHVRYAGGIWLDYRNVNTRVTGNLIADIQDTLHGGIFLEVSQEPNMIDHNIVWKVTMGEIGSPQGLRRDGGHCILTTGSDEDLIAHNLFAGCEGSAVATRTSESRIVGSRGGTARWNKVLNNVFLDCGRFIDFSNKENTADGNLYAVRGALNWIQTPETLRLDLRAWQRYFGFDRRGASADFSLELDPDALTMTWSATGDIPDLQTLPAFSRDYAGAPAGKSRKAGPFLDLPAAPRTIPIDPRRK